MTSLSKLKKIIATVTAVTATAGTTAFMPLAAHATGFMVARFGGERGNPMTDSPTALYYNPAGIAFGHGTRIYVEGLFAYRSLSFDRDPAGIDSPNQGTPDLAANSGQASLGNFIVSPFLGVATDFGVPNLAVGAAFYVPFGGSASWDKNSTYANDSQYPGAVDGSQRWWDIEGQIRAMYGTVGGAYKLQVGGGELAFGLGANVVIHQTFDLRASNADGSDDLVRPSGDVQEGRALLDTSGVTFALGIGVQWRPTPQWTVGASYQSQPGFGEMSEKGTLEKRLGAAPTSRDDVDVAYALPDIVRLGVAYGLNDQVELRLWGSYERWSVFTKQCIMRDVDGHNCALNARGATEPGAVGVINNIPREWQDAFALRASGSYWLKPEIELMLGFGFDGNAVPDKTLETSLPDEMKLNGTVGATFRDLLANGLTLYVAYSAFLGLERTIAPRARSTTGEATVPYDPPSRIPDSAGTYHQFVGLLTVGAGYTF